MKKRFSEEQIIGFLREAEAGIARQVTTATKLNEIRMNTFSLRLPEQRACSKLIGRVKQLLRYPFRGCGSGRAGAATIRTCRMRRLGLHKLAVCPHDSAASTPSSRLA